MTIGNFIDVVYVSLPLHCRGPSVSLATLFSEYRAPITMATIGRSSLFIRTPSSVAKLPELQILISRKCKTSLSFNH